MRHAHFPSRFCRLARAEMPRFFTGDELGTVKSIRYSQGENPKEWKADSFVLAEGGADGKTRAVQKLSVCSTESGSLVSSSLT